MRRIGTLLLLSAILPQLGFAQDLQRRETRLPRAIDPQQVVARFNEPAGTDDCFNCVLGIFDDAAMTQRTGMIQPGVPKDIYLGLQLTPQFQGVTGLEFSIAGIRQTEDAILVLGVSGVGVQPAVTIGSPQSPADTSQTTVQAGGMNVAWSECVPGNIALLRIQILTFMPVSNKVLQVKRKYPPSNSIWQTPVFTQCDPPAYTATRVTGGCYGLNMSGPSLPCDMPTNSPPVCDAGGPYTAPCTQPSTSILLNGLGSFDPDPNTVLTYSWTTNCPGAVIQNPNSPTPLLTIPTPAGSIIACSVFLTVSDGLLSRSCEGFVGLECPRANNPPICDVGGPYTAICTGPRTAVALDGTGSVDPDTLDAITFSWTSNCPGASFDNPNSPTPVLTLDTPCCSASCTVTLVVSDGEASSECTASVSVSGDEAPGGSITLWPPNHQYETIDPTQCVVDACGDPVSASQVRVVSVSSDEPEDANGNGDGNTLDDIVIECPNVVRLRSERAGPGNGRVYTIRYAVQSSNGGETEVVCTVGVPHDQGHGDPILGPGPGYTVQANCPLSATPPRPRAGDPLAAVVESPRLRISRDPNLGVGFSFALERVEPAHVEIFDIAGRRLARVEAAPFVGPQTIYWDGRNADGREVATGIYLVRAHLNGALQHGKVLWRR